MKSVVFTGVAATALIAAAAPAQASDSFTARDANTSASTHEIAADGTRRGRVSRGGIRGPRFGGRSRVGRRIGGKRYSGARYGGKGRGIRTRGNRGTRVFRTGGNRGRFFGFYQRPFFGFNLPRYWIAPSFAISNYNQFGLSRPQSGYSWSRYYDDAVLRNNAGQVYDYRQNIDWSRGGAGFAPNGYYNQQQQQQIPAQVQSQNAPRVQAERDVYGWGEETYRTPKPEGTTERGVYDGEWTGKYVDPENRVYRGEWNGTYTNDQGRVYQGTYRGTSTGDPVFREGTGGAGAPFPQQPNDPGFGAGQVAQQQALPPQPAQLPQQAQLPRQPLPQQANFPAQRPQYQTPNGFFHYEKCLKKRGITGGAIGAIVGAVAGNRIGGRGNRLAGSLIGGGVGAISGALIEKAINKCEKFLPSRQVQQPSYPQLSASAAVGLWLEQWGLLGSRWVLLSASDNHGNGNAGHYNDDHDN